MTATATRRVTFAGALDHGDWTMSADCTHVTIDREQRDLFSSLPADARAQIEEVTGRLPGGRGMLTSAAVKYGPTSRSPRRYCFRTAVWHASYAGLGLEDVAECTAPAAAAMADEVGLPSGDLEMWLLPVVDFTFQFLITPADEAEATP